MSDTKTEHVPDVNQKHAEMIRAERVARGWNQGELAQALKLAGLDNFYQQTVARVELGVRPLRLSEAVTIARVFGYPDIDVMLRTHAAGFVDEREQIRLQAEIAKFESERDSIDSRLRALRADLERVKANAEVSR